MMIIKLNQDPESFEVLKRFPDLLMHVWDAGREEAMREALGGFFGSSRKCVWLES